jgi:mRNA-degrading endonuclease toxin of MazEF toxin-antitoxin module
VAVRRNDPLFAETHLATDSVIMADHLATVETTLIDKKLGEMRDMSAVETALRVTFAL